MDWLFDGLIDYLLNGMAEGLDTSIQKIFELSSTSSTEFASRVPALDVLSGTIDELAKALLLMMVLFVLFKNFFSFATGQRQPIIKTFFMTLIATFLCYTIRDIFEEMRYFFDAAYMEFLGVVNETTMAEATASGNANTDDILRGGGRLLHGFLNFLVNSGGLGGKSAGLGDIVAGAAGSAVGEGNPLIQGMIASSTSLTQGSKFIMIVLLVMLIIESIKLMIEAIERFMVISIGSLFAPLAMPWCISEETERVTKSYFKMMVTQYLMMIMNVVFLGLAPRIIAAIGYGDMGNNTFDFGILFAIAWMKAGQQVDSYLRAMGADVAITGRGLGESLIGAGRMVMGGFAAGFPMFGRAAGGFAQGIGSGLGFKGALAAAGTAAVAGSRLGQGVQRGMSGASNHAAKMAGLGKAVQPAAAVNAFKTATEGMTGDAAQKFANQVMGANAEKLGINNMSADGFSFKNGVFTAKDGNRGIAIASSPDKLHGKNPIVPIKAADGSTVFAQNLGTKGIATGASEAGKIGSMESVFGSTSNVAAEHIAAMHCGTGMHRYADSALTSMADAYGISLDEMRSASFHLNSDGSGYLEYAGADGMQRIDVAGELMTEGRGNDMVGISYALHDAEGNSLGMVDVGSVAMMGADTDLTGGNLIEDCLDANTFFTTGHLDDVTSDEDFKNMFSETIDGIIEDTYGANNPVSVIGYDADNHAFLLDNDEVLQLHDLAEFEGDKNVGIARDNSGAAYNVVRAVADADSGTYIPKQKIYHRGTQK